MSSVPDILYVLISPWDSKEPLAVRLTEAAHIFHDKRSLLPNVALISGGDWEAAHALTNGGATTYSTQVNGKQARIRLQASPFGGLGRDVYMGRNE